MGKNNIDEVLGITRCVQCGHRLDGEIECPFCKAVSGQSRPRKRRIPKWVFVAACFLSSPLSLFVIIKAERLSSAEKVIAFSGCLFWLLLFGYWF